MSQRIRSTASGGGRFAQTGQELVDVVVVALDLDDRARAVVAHRTGKAERGARCVDERPEADALDDSAHADPDPAPPVTVGHGVASRSSPLPISLQPGHGGVGACLVGLLDDEPHVDDHPVAGAERLLGQHADVHLAVLARDVDERELVAVAVQHPDDLTGYSQTHGSAVLSASCDELGRRRRSIAATASGTAAATAVGQAHALVDVVDLASDDDGRRRRPAERGEAGEHRGRIHAVRVETAVAAESVS